MKLFKKKKSKFYWYDFTVRGERFRGSTMEANATRATKIVGLKLAQATEDSDPLPRKAPTLAEFALDFLKWVDEARREEKTKIYYRDGWLLLCRTRLAGMRLDHITPDVTEQDRLSWFAFQSKLRLAHPTPNAPYGRGKETGSQGSQSEARS